MSKRMGPPVTCQQTGRRAYGSRHAAVVGARSRQEATGRDWTVSACDECGRWHAVLEPR